MPKKSNSTEVCATTTRKLTLVLLGFCLGMFGIVCGMYWEEIFNGIVQKEMILRPDSRVYENWKNPPLALSLDIYLFNWTNPEDFRNSSAKPILQQLGPYRFTEKPDKVDIKWHPQNASVTYRRKSDFYFDAKGSKGSLEDEVITLNAVALSAAAKGKHWEGMRRGMIDVGLKLYGQEMSVIRTADELLFTGYNDDMIDIARVMPIFGKEVEVPFDKFGWFYTRNGSADLTGVFNVYTGADDISKIGQMHSWNYKTHSGYFSSYCGMTNGSAGEFQRPHLKMNDTITLFTPDMCRTIPLDYEETVEVEGLKGYKYIGGQRSVDNGSTYPENLCFCGGECVPSGVMNISACRFGSPVFMSYPHFYNADPMYVNQVVGLDPNEADHGFYMILEPTTGIALEVAARFQVNMLVEPIEGISLYHDTPRIFFPLIWFEQKVRITPELAGNIKMVPNILLAGQIFAGVCFAVGLLLLCWYPIEQVWARHRLRSVDLKTPGAEMKKQKIMLATSEDIKANAVLRDKEKSLDCSPLLESGSKSFTTRIVPKSEPASGAKTCATPFNETLNRKD